MLGFGNNPLGPLPFFKNIGIQAKNIINQFNQGQQNQQNQQLDSPKQNTPNQSLVNTNSNINLNQQTQISPSVTQGALNASNQSSNPNQLQDNVRMNTDQNVKGKIDTASSQGAKDLPAYASIPNMSMKSWAADQQGKNYTSFDGGDKDLRSTLEGIEGFKNKNFDGSTGDDAGSGGKNKEGKRRALMLLSYVFSSRENNALSKTDLMSQIINFQKLGSNKSMNNVLTSNEPLFAKLAPPIPSEAASLENLDIKDLKYLRELIAMPKEFPEGVRLFSKEGIDIRPDHLKNFLEHRFEVIQSQLFNGGDPEIGKLIAKFVPLLNDSSNLLLPLILLYSPLPLPYIYKEYDFERMWKGTGKGSKKDLIASCNIYYLSELFGRFLIKFQLDADEEFSFDIQTSEENEEIVKELELAVAEIMFLLEEPPALSEFNVLLTQEIYEATDNDEELAIVSSGPLRLEIVLATYAVLFTLNRMQNEPDPAGIIELD